VTTGPAGRGQTPGLRPPRVRLVLVSDQPLVGDAVRVALESRDFLVQAMLWPRSRLDAAARRQVMAHRPMAGLVVGDLDDPRRRTQAAGLVSALPMPWLLLVNDPQDVAWGELVAAGLQAVVPTTIPLEQLVHTLHALMARRLVMSRADRERRIREWRADDAARLAEEQRMRRLSPREHSVLALLYDGLTVRAIADLTGVSEGTVRSQVKAVLRKLEVSSQLAAVAAYRRSLPVGRGGPVERRPQ
jgi:RNA polymerase sigma factor (sigma-70 family)